MIPLIGEAFVVVNAEKELFATNGFRWGWTKNVHNAVMFPSEQEAKSCQAMRESWVTSPMEVKRVGFIWIDSIEAH